MSLWVCSKWNEQPTDEEKIEVNQYGEVYQSIDLYGPERWVIFLPISHYRPCDPPQPPERWMDVTAECKIDMAISSDDHGRLSIIHTLPCEGHDILHPNLSPGYRLRKVQLYQSFDGNEVFGEQWAFVVEKKESA